MENIIEKLDKINDDNIVLDTWSLEEKKQLLEIYLIISKKESQIFDLIYRYHGCDSWEDIFRDYNKTILDDKARGVEIAIDEINERITEKH
jgi:hypothetical protein